MAMLYHLLPKLVASSAILTNNKGQILLLKRSKTSKLFTHVWQLPEGKIKLGENPKLAIEREISEETGLKIKDIKYKGKSVCVKRLFNVFPYLKIERHVFRAMHFGVIKLSFEHEDYKYFDLEKISQLNLLPGTLLAVRTYCKRGKRLGK